MLRISQNSGQNTRSGPPEKRAPSVRARRCARPKGSEPLTFLIRNAACAFGVVSGSLFRTPAEEASAGLVWCRLHPLPSRLPSASRWELTQAAALRWAQVRTQLGV